MPALPFEDSRRLIGANLYFASAGAVLEVTGVPADDELIAGWRARVDRARTHLNWSSTGPPADGAELPPSNQASVARSHACGASLALMAPLDQLFTATEVNEWALCAELFERDPRRWSWLEVALAEAAAASADDGNPGATIAPVLDESAAMRRFAQLAEVERRPELIALIAAATERDLPCVVDDEQLTLGAGSGGRSFPLAALPEVDSVPWGALHDIPAALVTGSNGKTTTVRLIAACLRAQGWRSAYNCTDGVVIDDELMAAGDYSGPAGARRVLRDPRTDAAAIETARGGILRRGLAVSRTRVAVVTNVSSDHFGEYGIHDLDALADVKLTVASVVPCDGLLVLNADDALLCAKAGGLAQRFGRCPPIGWFAVDAGNPVLRAHRAAGGFGCGARAGKLVLAHGGREHDIGAVVAMPLTVGGHASYNVANLAAAALTATALGVAPEVIASVFMRFGSQPSDNAGRLMRFDLRGVTILVDYAHNPDGIQSFLTVAECLRRPPGRLGVMLGHAGNRRDEDIRQVARVAVRFRPDLFVIAENADYLRGRAPGEVPQILRDELLLAGIPETALRVTAGEIEGVRRALDWAMPGDVLALPVHSPAARADALAMLQAPPPGGLD